MRFLSKNVGNFLTFIIVAILFCYVNKDLLQLCREKLFLSQNISSQFWDFKGGIRRIFARGNKSKERSIKQMLQLSKSIINATTPLMLTFERNSSTQWISKSLSSNSGDWVKGIGDCVPRVRRDVDLNTTMVVSFPGSGNSMIRYFILQATGYWVCEKKHNRRWPLLAKEQESLPCVVRKSHYSGSSSRVDSAGWPIAGYKNIVLFAQNGKPLNVSQIIANNRRAFVDQSNTVSWGRVILFVRNPFDTLKAEFLRRHKIATAEIFETDQWTNFVKRVFRKWLLFYVFWLNSKVQKLVVHFEELRQNIPRELRRIMRFLNLTHSDEIGKCVLRHPGTPRNHSATVDNPYEHFNETFIHSTQTFYKDIKELLNKVSCM